MPGVAFILSLAGILFLFAGVTGIVMSREGKVSALIKPISLRLALSALGFGLLALGVLLESRDQDKRPTIADVNLLITPIKESIQKQETELQSVNATLDSQIKTFGKVFGELKTIDGKVDQTYTDQHSNLLRIGKLLSRRDASLGS